ncbi:MAG: hypothetical protein CVU84_13450 [Firmicutes bacterium HGW-Firmicutes-1]|jgi:site-specific recombinase XerD|nr:MAG: hypothetical protein CVU84_13450 [Firmicutes bacterium HGW-Firmicutes-1]
MIKYIKRRTPTNAKEKYLFLDRNNEPLGKNCIKMMFQELKRYVPRVHAHLCRHTYATNFLISQKGDIYHLSKLMGHSEVKTTEIYF